MGRSFSFSRAWERNERDVQRRQGLMDLAQQIARNHGEEDPAMDGPVRYGDELEKEVKRYQTGDDLERETNWIGYREGSEMGVDHYMTHGGKRVLVIGKETDYSAGTHKMRYVVEEDDGSIGGEYEATWERTGAKQHTLQGTRRVSG